MKIRLLIALVGLAIGFILPIFTQQKDTVDPQTAQQIRTLRIKFDEAFNRNDPAAVAALYAEDGVWVSRRYGAFHGRQAIEKAYVKEFGSWHPSNLVGRVDRVIAVGNDVRAYGTWSDTYRGVNGGPINVEGSFLWVNVREGNTWKIRKYSSSVSSNSHSL
jgi:uncharacterized protein (TIGR02246 family)